MEDSQIESLLSPVFLLFWILFREGKKDYILLSNVPGKLLIIQQFTVFPYKRDTDLPSCLDIEFQKKVKKKLLSLTLWKSSGKSSQFHCVFFSGCQCCVPTIDTWHVWDRYVEKEFFFVWVCWFMAYSNFITQIFVLYNDVFNAQGSLLNLLTTVDSL